MQASISANLHKGGLPIPDAAFTDQAEFIRTVRLGLPGSVVQSAIELLGDRDIFIRLLNTTSGNLSRFYRKKNLGRVDSEELLDTLRVFFQARGVWENDDLAREWLHTAVPALNGERPIDLFDTFEGRNWVRQILRKIELGEFS